MNKLATISTKISQEEKELLVQYCESNDITLAQLMRKALKEYFAGR